MLPCEIDWSSRSRSATNSPQITNLGSSRGAAVSSAANDIFITVVWAQSGESLSGSGSPRYVCRTSKTSIGERESMLVSGNGAYPALSSVGMAGNFFAEETDGNGGLGEGAGDLSF